MFHIKICGVTTPADARLAAEAGADCIGLNFVDGSPRRIDAATARAIAAALPAGVLKVGVFAGMPADEIRRIATEAALDAIQLHGLLAGDTGATDPPERCADLAGLPVIRAVRLEPAAADPLAEARAWIAAARAAGAAPAMAIVDATVAVSRETGATALGGTGATVDWKSLASTPALGIPVALAGGLTPENVAAAIRQSGCRAVDTASGVELAPGHKDPVKVRAFVQAARAALRSSTQGG